MTSRGPSKRRPGRPKEPEKREHLLVVARGIFALKGYDGARLQQIADEAGVSKPALFHHFSGKDELYEGVLDAMVKELAAFIYSTSSQQGSYRTRLRELAQNLADYFGSHPDAAKLLLREFVNNGPYTNGRGKRLVENTLRMAIEFVEAGIEEGSFNGEHPERLVLAATADLLFYYGAHEVSGAILRDDALSPENIATQRDELAEHFCRLVKA